MGTPERLAMMVPGLIWGGEEWDFYREFRGSYLGFHRSSFSFAYPGASVDYWQQNLSMPWVSLYDADRNVGVYFGNHNPEVEFSALWGEMIPQPDFASPMGRSRLLWPHPERTTEDIPIGVTLGWAFFPLLEAGPVREPTGRRALPSWDVVRGKPYYRAWFNESVASLKLAAAASLHTMLGKHVSGGARRADPVSLPRLAEDRRRRARRRDRRDHDRWVSRRGAQPTTRTSRRRAAVWAAPTI